MKKKLYLRTNSFWVGFLLLFSVLGFSQPITVNTTTYTPEQLVKDVLIKTPCAQITNVSWSTGSSFATGDQSNGIGYFQNTNPAFDMADGIILSTGKAIDGPGPRGLNGGSSSGTSNAWPDDLQLTTYMNNILGNTDAYHNATILEFDFVPFTSEMQFNFIFASEEYGTFQCNFSDAFAFFLTNTVAGTTTNLALVPNTTDPISVVTIRDAAHNANCPSVNEQFFDSYNDGSTTSAINFRGQTVKMTAESPVVPFTKYRIKMVIQDRGDSALDSAVFIEGGSFNIGNLNLGNPVLIENGEGLCVGDSYTLNAGLDPNLFTFEWFKDGVQIPGQTGSTLTVTETGDYHVVAFVPNVLCDFVSDPVRIEFFDYVTISAPQNISLCPSSGSSTRFNLDDALTGVTSNPDILFSYYLTQQDAENDTNAISNFYNLPNSTTGSLTIWVRAYELNNPCPYVTSFTISLLNCSLTLNPLPDLSICEGASVQTFDLTVQTPVVYNNAAGYIVTYHLSKPDADTGINAIPSGSLATYNGTNGERIWVRVTDSNNSLSFGVTSFYLYRNLLPLIQTTVLPITACENGNTGLANFDLNLAYSTVPVSPLGVSLEFYSTQQDALLGNTALMLPVNYTGAAGTIYVRVRNLDGDCFTVVPLQLQIINTPVANSIAPLTYCDLNNDGFGEFNLDVTRVLIAGNPMPANSVVTFHETQGDADANANAIFNTGAYINKVKDQQTIYVRVGFTNSSCYNTVPLVLIVNKTPAITPIRGLQVCDINNDGVETVNLRSKESEMLTGLNAANYTVSYHISSAAAMANTGAIGNPTNFSTSVSTVVYVRVTDNTTGCFVVSRINIELVAMPVVANPLPTVTKCDTNGDGFEVFDLASLKAGIIGTQQGLDVSFHYNNSDAQTGLNPLANQYQNVSANVQTIYVRVFNASTGCFVVSTMNLEVKANPVITVPSTPYVICSDSGFGTINIYLYGKALIDATGQNYGFQFFETESDAMNNINNISNPVAYNNLTPGNSTIWIRVNDPVSGCFSVYPIAFQLVVPPKLPASLPKLVECDVLGSTQDQLTIFDLTEQNAALLAAQTAQGTYQIRYFTTQALANSNTNWIVNPTQFQNTVNPQTIWVRIEDTSKPGGCARVMSFQIEVAAPFVLQQPLPIVLCDTDQINDGLREFDLTIREYELFGGQPPFGTVINYYLTQQAAENDFNKIANPSQFYNTVNPQTIYIGVENQYGCRSVTTLTLRVLPVPEPNYTPTPLELCEDTFNSGMATFDLRDAEASIGNFGNYTYTYYASEIGAHTQDPLSLIGTPSNFFTGTSQVYVRVENSFTDTNQRCYVVVVLDLVVHPWPTVGPMTTLAACMDNPTRSTKFNLRDKDAQALGTQDPAKHIVRYFATEENAEDNVNPLPYTYENTTLDRQQIWVRVENSETGCFNISTFFIQIEQAVYAFAATDTEFCETDFENDGVSIVDLSGLDAEIIGNQPAAADVFVQYERWDGTIVNKNSVQVFDGEVIRAVVKYTDTNLVCSASVTFTVRLKDAPEVLPLENGVVCYEYRDQFALISGHYLETGIQENTGYTIVWTRDGQPLTPAVADVLNDGGRLYVKRGGTYQVVVTGPNGCSTTRTAVVSEAPSVTIDEVKLTDSFGDTNAIEVMAYAGPGVQLEYKLDNGPWQDSNIFLDVTPGEHSVYVRIQGQPCEASKVINVMDYPKYFTPNNDGYNDTWNIWSLKNQPNAKIYIFDRFGKLLKQLSGASEGWDGTFNGKPMPSTDYWFKAEYVDPKTGLTKEVTGHFSLKR
ncbi:T9SS type B sorting domain-containing protein [Flavobacterium sp. CBA20B-1]|uniref:T9SS type B sorting domain-containing protein n=1 Tax=unclassified Flavobacterium TaxID=196869 RepID=UPI002225016B|nr:MULTISPECIES: T9SS type B sorting domain-containing protein [unclassified Flavobacterium]WCM41855.1 T9SS type B sorting domain-containing protein [Flavobacterium sp. CBA20B-1]